MGHQIATLALGPILLLQGRAVRRKTPRLAEPAGPRSGAAGRGPRLRIAIVGDSAAAGVGAADQGEALIGRLVSHLAQRHRVEWRMLASTGATTRSTLDALPELGSDPLDVVVLSLGVNDVTTGLSRSRWVREQRRLRAEVRRQVSTRHVLVCGLPPVHAFPALPQPLRWYLGRRARQFDADLRADVAPEVDASFLSLEFAATGPAASDGYHPSPAVYAAWGARAAALVLERLALPD